MNAAAIERTRELLKKYGDPAYVPLDLFKEELASSQAEAAALIAEAQKPIVVEPTDDSDGIIDLDPEPTPAPTTPSPRVYEGFLAVAMRAHARGERVLPIAVGAKNPTMKWKGSVIDTDSTEQWAEHSEQWIRECAAQFPDAAVCVVAKPNEFCFIDEDSSEEFRKGYEEFAGESFPHTFTTESRPGHRQSHWLQTDMTRTVGNVSQIIIDNKQLFSFRQHNLYVLSEGSPHPKGTFYNVFDAAPIVSMPAKLVEYMRRLKEQAQQKANIGRGRADADGRQVNVDIDTTPSGSPIPYGSHDATLTQIAGKIHRNEPDLSEHELDERLIAICEARCESYGSDYKSMTAKIAHSVGRYEDKDKSIPLSDAMKERITKAQERQKTAQQTPTPIVTAPVQAQTGITPEMIDKNFPSYDGKPCKKPRMLIDGFLMGGVNFFGAQPGGSKSWLALQVAKSLTTGEPLFGIFPAEKCPVLYLTPEVDEESLKYRLGLLGVTQDPRLFRYRTVSQGQTLALTDDLVLAVIKQLHADGKYKHVVLMIDTAICFMMSGKDMSSATNNNLRSDVEKLRSPEVGADILFLHHATKAMSKEEMTLQNVLRDTSDFGAMADCIFGLRRDDKLFDFGDGPEEVDVLCVKTRAPETPRPFRFRLKRATKPGEDRPVSVIEETGALQYVGDAENDALMGERLNAILRSNSATTMRMLKDELRLGHQKIRALAQRQGWVLKPISVFDPQTGRQAKKFLWSQIASADTVSPEDRDSNSEGGANAFTVN